MMKCHHSNIAAKRSQVQTWADYRVCRKHPHFINK